MDRHANGQIALKHSPDLIRRVLQQHAQGRNAAELARQHGLPYHTVRHWLQRGSAILREPNQPRRISATASYVQAALARRWQGLRSSKVPRGDQNRRDYWFRRWPTPEAFAEFQARWPDAFEPEPQALPAPRAATADLARVFHGWAQSSTADNH